MEELEELVELAVDVDVRSSRLEGLPLIFQIWRPCGLCHRGSRPRCMAPWEGADAMSGIERLGHVWDC